MAEGPRDSVLSESELAVVDLVRRGLTDAEIASALERTKKDVESTTHGVFQKLGVRSRVELVIVATPHLGAGT